MWFVYLIQHNVTKQIYIGYTNDIKIRLKQHNSGDTKSTYRVSGKWILKYSEIYPSKKLALDREQKLKHHGSVKQGLLKRLKDIL